MWLCKKSDKYEVCIQLVPLWLVYILSTEKSQCMFSSDTRPPREEKHFKSKNLNCTQLSSTNGVFVLWQIFNKNSKNEMLQTSLFSALLVWRILIGAAALSATRQCVICVFVLVFVFVPVCICTCVYLYLYLCVFVLVWRILIGAVALSATRQCVMWHWDRRRTRKKALLVTRVLLKGCVSYIGWILSGPSV